MLIVSLPIHARLTNFVDVKKAVLEGIPFYIVVNFAKCESTAPSKFPSSVVGAYQPKEIIIDDNGSIAASMTHFTKTGHAFPGKSVYEYARYTINQDNTMKLTSQVLDAVKLEPLTESIDFTCKFNEGVNFESAFAWSDDSPITKLNKK